MRTKVGFEYRREVPEAWVDQLRVIAPPSEHLSSLHLRWEAGDRWDPIQRWMIWQLRPAKYVRPEILEELKGPSPRSTGHYCASGYCQCMKKKDTWVGGAARMIDHAQWELYRETGCYGSRWWCIQGPNGGHRHRLDEVESRVSRLFGGASDTPAPGDLPYAEFDARTFYAVAQQDKVRVWKHMLHFLDRNHDQMDAEEMEAKVEVQKLLWGWLENQTSNTGLSNKDWSEFKAALPVVPGLKDDTDYEKIHEEFITQPNY